MSKFTSVKYPWNGAFSGMTKMRVEFCPVIISQSLKFRFYVYGADVVKVVWVSKQNFRIVDIMSLLPDEFVVVLINLGIFKKWSVFFCSFSFKTLNLFKNIAKENQKSKFYKSFLKIWFCKATNWTPHLTKATNEERPSPVKLTCRWKMVSRLKLFLKLKLLQHE